MGPVCVCVMVRVLAGVKEAGLNGCPGTAHWAWASLTCMGEEGGGEMKRNLGGRGVQAQGRGRVLGGVSAGVPSVCPGGPGGRCPRAGRGPPCNIPLPSSLWDTLGPLWVPSRAQGWPRPLGSHVCLSSADRPSRLLTPPGPHSAPGCGWSLLPLQCVPTPLPWGWEGELREGLPQWYAPPRPLCMALSSSSGVPHSRPPRSSQEPAPRWYHRLGGALGLGCQHPQLWGGSRTSRTRGTLGGLFNISVPQFPHLEVVKNKGFYFTDLT